MPDNDEDPPIRLVLSAICLHGMLAAGALPEFDPDRKAAVDEALKLADELLRQAGPR